MDKNNFFTRLARWPKLTFTDVQILVIPEANPQPSRNELYVRDRSEPPARLFICRLPADVDLLRVERTYQLWLDEFIGSGSPQAGNILDNPLFPLQPAYLYLSRDGSLLKRAQPGIFTD